MTNNTYKGEEFDFNTKTGSLLLFNKKEEKLFELLVEYDESKKMSSMYIGIIRVLTDIENPVRYSQASNTIRCLADELLNNNKVDNDKPLLEVADFGEIEKQFGCLLDKTLSKINDTKYKEETTQQAERKYKDLIKVLNYGSKTKNQRLLELLGYKKDIKILPEKLQTTAEELVKIYKYYTGILHNHDIKINEEEFNSNWLLFQDFLILVTSEFFKLAKEIDSYLEEETKSGEGFK